MNSVFKISALEFDAWFVRNEMAYRSELAAIKAFMPKEGRGLEIGVGKDDLPRRWGYKRG
jgi:hypothetical protein